MTYSKTSKDIDTMRVGGQKLGAILLQLLDAAKPNTSLQEIEALAVSLIAASGGTPSFQTVKGYKWATCLCVNDVVVHGIPGPYRLKNGDILTVDVGLLFEGFHTDTAWSLLVGTDSSPEGESKKKFLAVGQEALENAIAVAKIGNRIGHISEAFQNAIVGSGYSVVRTLVGHGVGRELHEPPQVPGYLKGRIVDTLPLAEGMTLALEIIYTQGSGAVEYANTDGWTIATKDGSLSAVFEHTIAIHGDTPIVLTSAIK